MTKLYENIKMLCKERNISVRELERQTGFKPSTMHKWGNKEPLCESVSVVACYFDVSVDFLLGFTNNRFSHKNKLALPIAKVLETCMKYKISDNTAEVLVKMIKSMSLD